MKTAGKPQPLGEVLRDVADEPRLAYNWSRIEERRHSRPILSGRLVLASVSALATVAVVIGLFAVSKSHQPDTDKPLSMALPELMPVMAVPSRASEKKRVILSDGSRLTLAPGATLEVIENSRDRFETALLRGWVRFNVTPGKNRTWVIDAGLARIVVIGTQFTVSRTPQAVKVAVHRGMVALRQNTSQSEIIQLTAGESRQLTAPASNVRPRCAAPTEVAVMDSPASEDASSPAASSTKRVGRRKPSSKPIGPAPESPVADLAGLGSSEPVNALLREVDEARKNKKPKKAAALLARILREFPDDPAGGLVALTLGRIRLNSLHQPRAAAGAFKYAAKHKYLPAPLREQAYARCVEAFHHAGNDVSASAMGEFYQKRYPNSAWLPWVEYWAGLE